MNFELFQTFQTFFQRNFAVKNGLSSTKGSSENNDKWLSVKDDDGPVESESHGTQVIQCISIIRSITRDGPGPVISRLIDCPAQWHQERWSSRNTALSAAFYLFLPPLCVCVAAVLFFAADAPAIDRHSVRYGHVTFPRSCSGAFLLSHSPPDAFNYLCEL